MDPRFPLTVYYTFRRDDEGGDPDEDDPNAVDLTTGWETLLEALISSGFQITATWPCVASCTTIRSLSQRPLLPFERDCGLPFFNDCWLQSP
jgi:adenine-specific DNA methylase